MDLLTAQNQNLDKGKLAELTYGPKRAPDKERVIPRFLALDKKILRFEGYFQEDVDDWSLEKYRIRRVIILYYLQNDTMEVTEPKVPNSGLVQGILLKRHAFPHPRGNGRQYLWKDLNLGMNLHIYGKTIRITDCDPWTREYLIDAGLELNAPEEIPPDPYEQQKRQNAPRQEGNKTTSSEDEKLYKFLMLDGIILRFYGIWQDIVNSPPDIRRVILLYYLADDTLELLEDHAPNSGRPNSTVLVRKQKVPYNFNELPDNFPRSYLEMKEGDVRFFKAEDLRTGKDVLVYGKKIFLYDCDDFTRHYYNTHYGLDLESIAVAEKPKPQVSKVIPPHNGIGDYDDSLQNCLAIRPKRPKKNIMKELYYDGVALRYKAELVTPIENDKNREFVITFYPSDDTVAINEESKKNSGFGGGAFLRRMKLSRSESTSGYKPIYYEAKDFGIGSEIHACGKLFRITDADRFVLTFMEQQPELFTEEQIETHRRTVENNTNSDSSQKERDELIEKIRSDVVRRFGLSPYPLHSCLDPPCDLQYREKVDEELYCANMPISTDLLRKVVDICTDGNDRTDMNEVRKIILPGLGHDINK